MDDVNHSRIVRGAAELFNAKGYRRTTLSELALQLGMSKKTLYVYFSGKEEIAEEVLKQTMQVIAFKVTETTGRQGNPLLVLGEVFAAIKQELIKLNPVFLEDIQKYMPALWKRVEDFRADQLKFIEGLLNQAQQTGLIRDMNPKLVSSIMMQSIQTFVRPDFASKHGVALVDVADTLFSLFTTGLQTKNNE
ncbi:TetR family transcriptional regulator [Paenibacillus sp. LMG 31456]|uniref:TetR family transcriptional regulator n=1 Tax=Paenibacillus foliorum TaxID=2654974 RepID=A0A972JZK2_9BACL|nr:TetR/AcrR family transcriptional regulator [Paenibacillus foliorum]NOU93696.1 TetR family transcriptional regulator [Paenibacillus foliorum]